MPSCRAKARVFVDADLAAGVSLDLVGGPFHYLRHVMRLGVGDAVALFNGRDGEWLATVGAAGKSAIGVALGERLRPQRPEGDLWVAFAPIIKARTDFIVEKATELGASRLLPVITRRTEVSRVNVDRLTAHAVEAAEQCGRLTVPGVDRPVALDRLAADWPADRVLLVLDETGGGRPIGEVLLESRPAEAADPVGPHGFLIGPVGGFEADELDGLGRLPFAVRVGMGSRILRVETAVVSALACWQALMGDWRQ